MKESQQCSLLDQHINPSLPCDCRHNKPISQSCDFYKILIQMSVKVTLWLFKAVLHSHLAALFQSPFPVWLSSPVNTQTEQAASTLSCSPVQTTRGKPCQTEAGLGLSWARQGKPWHGHTSIAGSWVDKAMCIWDGEGIGVSIPPPMSQEKHLMLRETAVQWR